MTHPARPSSRPVPRRLVLGGAGASLGLLFVAPAAQAAGPGSAAGAGAGLQVLPPGEETWVATGSATQARLPAVLGARLRTGTRHAAGTVVSVSWDRRLYEQTVPQLVGDDGRAVRVQVVGKPITDAAGQTTTRVKVTDALVAGTEYLLSLGARRTLLYPHDVVTAPLPITVVVGDGAAAGSRHALAAAGTASSDLWGACVGAGWQQVSWGRDFHSWTPSVVTVRATGPGAVPAGSVVEVRHDERLVGSATVEDLDGTVLTRSHRGAGGLLVVRWTLAAPLLAGHRVSYRVQARPSAPAGALPGLQAPTVSLRAAKASPGQRTTGLESLTRTDSAFDDATVATYGLAALAG
ncbi:hypothetical protein GCM10025782_20160 [Pedococcus ginsenosidimutans]|uniref:Uncharacterized protein n=1 Tax=Pedococcus ginsenosidimutans TaxID=490570 RepID=A0ABP8Y8W9_9MICO